MRITIPVLIHVRISRVDAGQNLQDPMLTRIPATAQTDLIRTKDTAIRGRKKEDSDLSREI
jgi:hypothetical protein